MYHSVPTDPAGRAGSDGPRQARNAISLRSDKVPDVLVFLETLESVAPQIKSTGIDPLARVRM